MAGVKGRSGRRRKPDELKRLAGNPGGRKLAEPLPNDERLLEPPADFELCEVAREEWKRVAPDLLQLGMLHPLYSRMLHLYCTTYAYYVEAGLQLQATAMVVRSPNGHPMLNPYYTIQRQCAKMLVKLMREFGMTPASRITDVAPMFFPSPGAGDKWDGLLQ